MYITFGFDTMIKSKQIVSEDRLFNHFYSIRMVIVTVSRLLIKIKNK